MKYYFKKFAKEKIEIESDPFIWLLYFIYCSLIDLNSKDGDLWEYLKERIKSFNIERRTASKIKRSSEYFLRNIGSRIQSSDIKLPKSQIKSLQVKDFRGFGSNFNGEDKGVYIEFNPQNTIFYGPNGSGKSSLCDALEFKLTGQVKEATRRNRKVNDFIKRIGIGHNPTLSVSFFDTTLNCEKLTDDEKNYFSQAFIEKNRIQEFSLFGSKDTGIKKEDILSILIGMDELSVLAKALVQPPTFRSNLLNFKRNDVASKIASLNSTNISNLTLKKTYQDSIVAEKAKGITLLKKEDVTITNLESELHVISSKIASINADTISISGITVIHQTQQEFDNLISSLEEGLKNYDELNEKISNSKQDLSYSKLYTAIQELKDNSTGICPACNTPLEHVTKNPFAKATEELSKLEKLKNEEKELATQTEIVETCFKSLKDYHNNYNANIRSVSALSNTIPKDSIFQSQSPVYSLTNRNFFTEKAQTLKKEVQSSSIYFTDLELLHQKQLKKGQLIYENNIEIASLNKIKGEIELIKANWLDFQKKLDEINVTLSTYSDNLKKFEIEKSSEDNFNNFIDSLIQIYPHFYSNLQSYKDREFQTRFGNLEKEIAGFYTQINQHDPDHDVVESFKINNLVSDYKIEYRIKGSPIVEDASIKFSEGHLRSLGLSILLANAKINSLPFIIFDDVVNAIDSDHRANIIEMMVNDKYLSSTQQILSTHDRLYWERFCITNQKDKFNSYVLKCTNQGIVHYNYNLCFKEKIQTALNHFDIRQALLYSRIWLESIAKHYCMENKVELKGFLKSNDFNISIEPSLGAIYRVLYQKLANNANLKILHQDEINYKGINQEHHSFDEFNFNFIHSRTSQEVQKIFDAVNGLNDDIQLCKNHISILVDLIESHKAAKKKLINLNDKMPNDISAEITGKYNRTIENLNNYLENLIRLNLDPLIITSAEKKIKIILIESILLTLEYKQKRHSP
jgi:DNA sulfur modification protein DndD